MFKIECLCLVKKRTKTKFKKYCLFLQEKNIRPIGYFSHAIIRGVSRRFSRRRRLEIFNFFRPSAAAVKKPSGNQRRRLRNFNFFLSVGGGGWKVFVLSGGGWKFFRSQCRRLKFFQDIF